MHRIGPISVAERAESAQRGRGRALDAAIAEVAERRHGVVTHAQLVAAGLSESAIDRRVRSGSLHRVHQGVYSVGHRPLTRHAHWMAAVLACGSDAVLSHAAAAALWGIRGSAAAAIDVTSPRRAGRSRPGIRAHRADTLHPTERTAVEGVPCTTVERTVLDLAAAILPGPLEYAIHRAQERRLLDLDQVAAAIGRSPTRRGTAAVRRILGIAAPGESAVHSPLERRMLRLCRAARLPPPQVNHWIVLPDAPGLEVDFCWPAHRLIVETDSRAHHATDRAFENDRRRDRLLTLAGWRVARFTHRDLRERPADVAAQLRRLLPSASTSAEGAAAIR